jgi:HSP20 family protein
MNMLKIDPFLRDIDRLTQQLWGTAPGFARSWAPLDAWRDGDTFIVEMDLPGIAPESLDVNVEQDMLTVRAERPEPADGRNWLVTERPHGVFTRQLSLGKDVDHDKITADYTDGVLVLKIPVAETAKPRKIAVVAGKQHQAISA